MSLSDKIGKDGEGFRYIEVKNVKQFIKKLKESLNDTANYPEFKCFKQECQGTKYYLDKLIDTLAGKGLA